MGRRMNFTGEHGGLIATTFIGAWATATAFWFGVGAVIWKLFFNPRLKALEDQLSSERTEWRAAMEDERRECARQLGDMRDRVKQLEMLLMLHGGPQLRQAMQAVASESHLAIDELKRGEK